MQSKSKLPKTIKIAGVTHTVKEVEIKDQKFLGTYSYSTATIEIEKRMPDTRKLEVLLHECTHGILATNGRYITWSKKNHEPLVDVLGSSLTDLLINNPDLVEYIRYVNGRR